MNRYDPDQHHRRSIRLPGYDYTKAGAYYVTFATQHRLCLFGEIENGTMRTNDAGRMVQCIWDEMPNHYTGVGVDAFVLMPNHAHGIILLAGEAPYESPDPHYHPAPVGAAPRGRPDPNNHQDPVLAAPRGRPGPNNHQDPVLAAPCCRPEVIDGGDLDDRGGAGQARGPAPTSPEQSGGVLSVADVVHRFKTMTTKRFADGVKQNGWPAFPGRLWQRNYYEHVIRDDASLNRVRDYIALNPARWVEDPDNPQSPTNGPLRGPTR